MLTIKQLVYILLFITAKLLAQHPVYHHLTEKDGLPDIEFYDIIEDKDGFIWLAADKGLFRYDGKTFKNYNHPQKKGLSVFGLQFDDKNRLWCNNISGQFFYVEKDSLRYFTELKTTHKGQLANFFIQRDTIHTSTVNTSYSIAISTKKVNSIFNETNYQKSIFRIKDSIFLAAGTSIYTKTKIGGKIIDSINNLSNSTQGYPKAEAKITALGNTNDILLQSVDYENNRRRFFLRNQYKFKELKPQDFNLNATIIASLVEGNSVWIATENGVYNYEYANATFTQKQHFFKNKTITKIIKDKHQNYWFTTLRNGVFIVPNIHFSIFENTKNKDITALEKISDSCFVYGTIKGQLTKQNSYTYKTQLLAPNVEEKVHKIAYNQNNKLLVSYHTKALFFNVNSPHLLTTYSKTFKGAKDICFLDTNKFVYGSFAFAMLANTKEEASHRIGHSRVYATHCFENNIYVGYVDGLAFYDEHLSSKYIQFNNQPIFALDISNTNDGTIWVATFSDGVIGIKNGEITHNYTTKNGLLSNQIRNVKGDKNNLWIVTDQGIQYLNTVTGQFQNLTKTDGFTSFNISDIAVFNDKVVFATNKGVYQFDTSKGFKTNTLTDFYFTQIMVEDEPVTIKDKYNLASDSNKLQFQFRSNGFLAEENSNYQYRLLGSSLQWNTVTKHTNQVTFNSLSPGNYTFQLKKEALSNTTATAIKSINIIINKPFYNQWWFIALAITTIILVLILIFKIREQNIRKQQAILTENERLQKEMVTSKLQRLQSQMNPHFVFNAMNAIQNLILKNDKENAYTYLTKFAALMRNNLKMSEDSFVYFNEELTHIKQYLELEKLRFRNDFTYTITGENDIDLVKIPSTIIQPFVENAIKHGLMHKENGKKILTIDFYQHTDHLKCIITDNGIGIAASKEVNKQKATSSFSTKAIKNKLEILQKYYNTTIGFYYEDTKIGTKVVLQIPFKI